MKLYQPLPGSLLKTFSSCFCLSSLTLIGLFCPSPYALSEKATVPCWRTAEPWTISHHSSNSL